MKFRLYTDMQLEKEGVEYSFKIIMGFFFFAFCFFVNETKTQNLAIDGFLKIDCNIESRPGKYFTAVGMKYFDLSCSLTIL